MTRRGSTSSAARVLALALLASTVLVGTSLSAGAADPGAPLGNLDSVKRVPGAVTVRGWAVDPDAGSFNAAVAVYAEGALVAYTAAATLNRPDVGTAYPSYGPNHGFQLTFSLSGGTHDICAVAINTPGTAGTDTVIGCRTVEVGVVFGHFDNVTGLSQFHASGWAIDPDTADPIAVAAFVDGVLAAYTPAADLDRPDVGEAFPGFGNAHGFDLTLTTAAGGHLVCVDGINAPGTGGSDVFLGCISVVVPTLFGNFEDVFAPVNGLGVRGWAADTDSPGVGLPITVYDNGQIVAYTLAATDNRPDVAAAYPYFGPNHGFSLTWTADHGTHVICVIAYNTDGTNGSHRILDCGTYIF